MFKNLGKSSFGPSLNFSCSLSWEWCWQSWLPSDFPLTLQRVLWSSKEFPLVGIRMGMEIFLLQQLRCLGKPRSVSDVEFAGPCWLSEPSWLNVAWCSTAVTWEGWSWWLVTSSPSWIVFLASLFHFSSDLLWSTWPSTAGACSYGLKGTGPGFSCLKIASVPLCRTCSDPFWSS